MDKFISGKIFNLLGNIIVTVPGRRYLNVLRGVLSCYSSQQRNHLILIFDCSSPHKLGYALFIIKGTLDHHHHPEFHIVQYLDERLFSMARQVLLS